MWTFLAKWIGVVYLQVTLGPKSPKGHLVVMSIPQGLGGFCWSFALNWPKGKEEGVGKRTQEVRGQG